MPSPLLIRAHRAERPQTHRILRPRAWMPLVAATRAPQRLGSHWAARTCTFLGALSLWFTTAFQVQEGQSQWEQEPQLPVLSRPDLFLRCSSATWLAEQPQPALRCWLTTLR